MQITFKPSPFPIPPALADALNPRSDNPGQVHVSQILDYMQDVIYGAKSDKDFEDQGWCSEVLCDAGFSWERLLELAWVDRLGVRIGEGELDSVVGSPDGLNYIDGHPCIEEYKFSWQGMDHAMDMEHPNGKWKRFIWQVMCYCKIFGVTRAVFHLLFVNGNYKDKRGAHYGSSEGPGVWVVDFEQGELDKHWETVLQVRDRILEKRKGKAQ